MSKPIEIILLPDAEKFVDNIEISARKKMFYAIRKTKMRVFGDWFEKLKSSKDIFEFRVKNSNKFFRLFAFWDSTGETETLIVCTHGLIKKSNKTPKKDIEKAEMIKEKYFKGLI
ncbi:MAG: type II toxin-antitoxin system RelE/ParE family toxin [Bacteroidetes bacterium]|nr:type II toxin-antitoxin system RelE/ParE family toxin [Bacteroidota bacterium]